MLIPSSQASLRQVAGLMEKYQDLPMDFADATLVALAEESQIDQVFTLDRRGFSTYRLHGRKSFRVIP
jgi:predicted nucleic acid-binding protein